MTRSAPPAPRLEIASTIRINWSACAALRSAARCASGHGSRGRESYLYESECQKQAQRQNVHVDAEGKVVTAAVQRQRDDECKKHKQSGRLPGPDGASKRELHQAHLHTQEQTPDDRTENS